MRCISRVPLRLRVHEYVVHIRYSLQIRRRAVMVITPMRVRAKVPDSLPPIAKYQIQTRYMHAVGYTHNYNQTLAIYLTKRSQCQTP
jgi:hypothetical protein